MSPHSRFKNYYSCFILLPCLFSAVCFGQSSRIWAGYYGDEGLDYGHSICTDRFGNVYMAGATSSVSGIAFNGFQNAIGGITDAFVVKFNAAGNRLWATYYGGAGSDNAVSVKVDTSGNVYLAGVTNGSAGLSSGGFQSAFGGVNDGFLVKFDSAGNRLWATYYGGSGYDAVWEAAVDISGNVYIGGYTSSTSGIASGGMQNTFSGGTGADAFLVKFDTDGNRIWGTYYGGTSDDVAQSICTDIFGNVYITGSTQSATNIASNGWQNTLGGGGTSGFLVKFNATGNRIWGTYYGGESATLPYSVAADNSGNVYIAGSTDCINGIASASGFQGTFAGGTYDAFLVKFDSSCVRVWATYYGGALTEYGTSVDVDPSSGNLFLSGLTQSLSGISFGGFQNILGGNQDIFLVNFDDSGNRICASYYGGSNAESSDRNGIDVSSGIIFLAGGTNSISDVASSGFQNTYGGGPYDAFLVKFTSCCTIPVASINGDSVICIGQNTTLTATGGETYLWNTGETTQAITVAPIAATSYYVTVTNGCGNDTEDFTLTTFPLPDVTISGNTSIDYGNSTTLTAASGTNTYLWNTGETTPSIVVYPEVNTSYTVTATDLNGCVDIETIAINVLLPDISVPTIFSPNDDGKNDDIKVHGYGIKEMKFIICDRWGEKVFETENKSEGWDGTFKGMKCDPAVFVYYLSVTCPDEQEFFKKGNITLIR